MNGLRRDGKKSRRETAVPLTYLRDEETGVDRKRRAGGRDVFMPKKKTSKSVAKRFRLTAKGKVKFKRPGRSHLLSGKSGHHKQDLRRPGILGPRPSRQVRHLLSS